MTLDDAKKQIDAALAAKSQRLIHEIRRMIDERPFLLDDGIDKDYVDGIHFEYEWDSFVPIACPLNTQTGYCGAGEALAILDGDESGVLPATIEEQLIDGAPAAQREHLREALSDVQTRKYEQWFADCWKQARGTRSMRGFLSIHDTIWRMDLDTGDEFREDQGTVKFFNDAA